MIPFRAGAFSWQDPRHSMKAGPGEVMTVENLFITFERHIYLGLGFGVCVLAFKNSRSSHHASFVLSSCTV